MLGAPGEARAAAPAVTKPGERVLSQSRDPLRAHAPPRKEQGRQGGLCVERGVGSQGWGTVNPRREVVGKLRALQTRKLTCFSTLPSAPPDRRIEHFLR